MSENCLNCGAERKDIFCPVCGEKKLSAEDFEISRLAGGFFTSLTNIDTKFFRTVRNFVGRPGQLSFDYFRGLRKPYLTPIQIFLVVSVLFFIFIRDFDLFYVPAKWFFQSLADNALSLENRLAMEKMAELELTRNELALKYDVTVSNYAKAFLFLTIPFLALGSYLSRPKAVPQFGKHMIFATHNLSFSILWFLVLLSVAFNLPDWTPRWLMMTLGFGGELIYFVLANRRAWGDSWLRAVFSGIFQLIVLTVFIGLYRSGISFGTLATL